MTPPSRLDLSLRLRVIAAVGIAMATLAAAGLPAAAGTPAPPVAIALALPDDAALAEHIAEAASTVVVVREVDGRPEIETIAADSPETARSLAAELDADPDIAAEVDHVVTVGAADPVRSEQWPLTRLGASRIWPHADASGQVIAIVDSGVDASHPDLAPVTLPGWDALVQDGNGWIDPHGHGTHVAGIAAAVADDGSGMSGLAWKAQILPVRVLGPDGVGYLSDVASGVIWAVDNGATVINLSLGGESSSSALRNAVTYAETHRVVVVASGGNDGLDSPVQYPAAYPETLAAAATTSNDSRASFSSTGSWIDVAAPGASIWSAQSGGGFVHMSGTSMAAPYVSAAAALLRAKHPLATSAQIRQLLTSTATDLGAAGRDDHFGHGLIDVEAALGLSTPVTTTTSTTSTTSTTTTTTTTIAPPPPPPSGGGGGGGGGGAPAPAPAPAPAAPAPTSQPVLSSLPPSAAQRTPVGTVQRLYVSVFGRVPDSGGLAYWNQQHQRGVSLTAIAGYFASSPEFRSSYGVASDTQFVTTLYQHVLGRTPDPGGLTYWRGVLASGRTSRAHVILLFADSKELVARIIAATT